MTEKRNKRHGARDSEMRERQAKRRLGSEHPICSICGNDDWRVLELHHIAGRAYDDRATIIVCKNCHAIMGDAQCDHPPASKEPHSILEIIGRFLLGCSDICAFVAVQFRQFGNWLIELAKSFRTEEVQLP